MRGLAILLSLTGLVVGSARANADGHFASRERKLMGTRFSIIAWVPEGKDEKALDDALDRVAELERWWSPWIAGSDVQRINADPGGTPVRVRPETFALLERSVAACLASGRAFDPTFFALQPLYDLRDPEHFKPPSADLIARTLPLVDCRKIELDRAHLSVRLGAHGMGLHLGANAKGTSLDEAARVLERAGLERYVVDGGGDIVCRGEGPKGPWRVGIQDPRGPRGETVGVLPATEGGVATSGDYERFAIIDGVRYHHIVDPRTGRSATGCMSATVHVPAGPHAGEVADSWATAMCVLGPEAGFPLLASKVPDATAAIITPDGVVHRMPGYRWPLRAPAASEVEHAP